MNNNELLKRASQLQKEALRIIDDIEILPILNKISEPFIVGSVKNGLMAWRDIDIHVYMENPGRDRVLSLMEELGRLKTIQKVQFSNFKEQRRDHIKAKRNFPQGYYIGLRSVQPSGEWKVDIWFKKEDPNTDRGPFNFSNLSKEQKIAILKIKEAWLDEGGGYKGGVTSSDIYEAVLKDGVMSVEDFKK